MYELESGKSYLVRIRAQNKSRTISGVLSPAEIRIALISTIGTVTPPDMGYSFAIDESKAFDFTLSMPEVPDLQEGSLTVKAFTAAGILIKQASTAIRVILPGTLRGIVTDAITGQSVAGATVAISESATFDITAADGSYELTGLETIISSREVSVAAKGYGIARISGVIINPGDNTLNISLAALPPPTPVPSGLSLAFTNKNLTSTRFWHAWAQAPSQSSQWVEADPPGAKQLYDPATIAITEPRFIIMFEELTLQWYPTHYGPYYASLPSLGEYSFDAKNRRFIRGDGMSFSTVDLRNKTGSIRGTVVNHSSLGPVYWLDIYVTGATTIPGIYLIGHTIRAWWRGALGGNSIAGYEIDGDLVFSGNTLRWEIANISYPSGYPAWFYKLEVSGSRGGGDVKQRFGANAWSPFGIPGVVVFWQYPLNNISNGVATVRAQDDEVENFSTYVYQGEGIGVWFRPLAYSWPGYSNALADWQFMSLFKWPW